MDHILAEAKRRADEAEARFQNAAKQEGPCNGNIKSTGWTSSSFGLNPGDQATVAGVYSDKPYRPASTLERIEKELSAHAEESRRVVKLEALRQLLEAHPEVARILELKAELGF